MACPQIVLLSSILLLTFLAPARRHAAVMQKKRLLESSPSGLAVLSAIADVHRDFKAKAHFGVFGLGPHGEAPSES
jgi:hypothetical protein